MARPLLALLAVLTACTPMPARVDTLAPGSARNSRDQVVSIPVTNAEGQVVPIQARICRPESDAPAGLVVINHGAPADAAERPRMQLRRCGEEATRWFLARGYVVAFPLRRGYGATGGAAAEASPSCRESDFVRSGLETARDIQATVQALVALPFIRPDRVVQPGPFGSDGHALFFGRGGSAIWGPPVKRYLAQQDALAR